MRLLAGIDEQVAAQLTQLCRCEARQLATAMRVLQQQVQSHALRCEARLAVSIACDEWKDHEQPEPCCCSDDVWWGWHAGVVWLSVLICCVSVGARVLKA
jgi:hypothetical protein